jgi:ketosteroid isomerase-like protein
MFSPEIVWNDAENFIYADRNPYVGPQAILEGIFMRLVTEWDGFAVAVEEIVGAGDTVIARGRYRGTCKATGVRVDAQFAHVWKLADGKVVRFQQYTDTAQFRDAVARPRSAGA